MSSFVPRSIRNLFTTTRTDDDLSTQNNKKRRRESDIFEFPGNDEESDGHGEENGTLAGKEKTRVWSKENASAPSSPLVKRAKRGGDAGLHATPDGVNGRNKGGRSSGLHSTPVRASKGKRTQEREEEDNEDVQRSSRVKRPTDDVQSGENAEDEDSDEEEIRRSSRARKPSAKVLEDMTQTPKSVGKQTHTTKGTKDEVLSADPRGKRGPGRPKKIVVVDDSSDKEESKLKTPPKRRGRPPKGTPSIKKSSTKPGNASSNQRDVLKDQALTPSKKSRNDLNETSKSQRTPKPSRRDEPDDVIAMEIDAPSKSSRQKTIIAASNEYLGKDDSVFHEDVFHTRAASVLKPKKNLNPVKWASGYPTVFKFLVQITLEKLSQRRPAPITHLNEEYSKVYSLVEATVTAGEGNSMLIIGARGSGKTTLVNQVLSELGKTQKKDFLVVRLNGFIQTDDKLALREIWRQLGREMEIDEEGGKSYSDTLTMLLATLSHPDEIAGERLGQIATSVVFVMDEFDLFATHARQTLLYNLLDIAQSRKAPIAVLGLTTKYDVTECLEKRVKSRFSHRYVHLPLAKNMVAFQEICLASVLINTDELTFEERSSMISSKHGSKQPNFLSDWNDAVKALFSDPNFVDIYVLPAYYLTKSVPTVLMTLLLPMASLLDSLPETSLLPVEHFVSDATPSLAPPPSTLPLILPSLSELQLSLLIAAARLDIIHDSDTCSFGMAYAEYVDLSSKARLNHTTAGALATGAGTRVWGREVARGEWETLVKLGLLVPVSENGGVAAVTLGGLVRVDVKLEEIPGSVPDLSGTMERWCRQI